MRKGRLLGALLMVLVAYATFSTVNLLLWRGGHFAFEALAQGPEVTLGADGSGQVKFAITNKDGEGIAAMDLAVEIHVDVSQCRATLGQIQATLLADGRWVQTAQEGIIRYQSEKLLGGIAVEQVYTLQLHYSGGDLREALEDIKVQVTARPA